MNTQAINGHVSKVIACHYRDCTNFLSINDEERLSFGAARNDLMSQAKELVFPLKETQQIVGFYGYKMKNDMDIIWRFSFILNNDF